MTITISTDLAKLNGPPFNKLESIIIKGLTRNDFQQYPKVRSSLFKKGISITQIFGDILLFRVSNTLSITKFMKFSEEEILSEEVIVNFEEDKFILEFESEFIFNESIYIKSIIIPNLLQEMLIYGLIQKFDDNMLVDRKKRSVAIADFDGEFAGFYYQFFIDDNYDIYISVDALYYSQFANFDKSEELPKSKSRIIDNEQILKRLKELEFFLGGKKYIFNDSFLSFDKIIDEQSC